MLRITSSKKSFHHPNKYSWVNLSEFQNSHLQSRYIRMAETVSMINNNEKISESTITQDDNEKLIPKHELKTEVE